MVLIRVVYQGNLGDKAPPNGREGREEKVGRKEKVEREERDSLMRTYVPSSPCLE